jgi:Xaa-Pro dipeptidase
VTDGREGRLRRLRAVMERSAVGAVLLRTPANFAWYTGGADNRVDHSSPYGVADIVVTRDGEYVLTNTIEAGRMRDEQTPHIEVAEFPWFGDDTQVLTDLTGNAPLGSDVPGLGKDITAELQQLRMVLDAEALEQYRQVGADGVAAMHEAMASLEPGVSETDAAAALQWACRKRGLNSPVAMAAGDDRITHYRHPVSHGAICHRVVMLVVCAERGGLFANLTRFVHFTEPDPEIQQRFASCETILRRLREESTKPGRTLAEVFADCERFYAEEGHPDEWKLHHQGGITGYASREIVITPSANTEIYAGMAFAYNPSITGAKAEETFVLTQGGTEVLTLDAAPGQ